MSELHDVDRRMAVLEQIARDTATALADIRSELRQMRTEFRSELQELRRQQHTDFLWLLRAMDRRLYRRLRIARTWLALVLSDDGNQAFRLAK